MVESRIAIILQTCNPVIDPVTEIWSNTEDIPAWLPRPSVERNYFQSMIDFIDTNTSSEIYISKDPEGRMESDSIWTYPFSNSDLTFPIPSEWMERIQSELKEIGLTREERSEVKFDSKLELIPGRSWDGLIFRGVTESLTGSDARRFSGLIFRLDLEITDYLFGLGRCYTPTLRLLRFQGADAPISN